MDRAGSVAGNADEVDSRGNVETWRAGERRGYARLCFSPSFRIAVVRMTANPPQTKPVITIIVTMAFADTVAPLIR